MKPAIVKLLCILLLYNIFISCKKEDTALSAGSTTKPDIDIIETLPPVQVAISYDLTANCAGFYRALPARYDSTSKRYPLLIFLHGSGGKAFSFIVLSPQVKSWTTPEDVRAMIQSL